MEDNRINEQIFKQRIIYPLNCLLKKVDKLNICLHPRSERSFYKSLSKTHNIIFDSYKNAYENNNNLFIGHYSTIIFKLISQSEKVILIDLDWDKLPNHIYDSCSLFLKWNNFNSELKNVNLDTIDFSKPNRKFLSMFENKRFLRDINITRKILG